MSNKLTTKILFGACFAILFGLAAGVLSAQADNTVEQTYTENCETCHYKVADVYNVNIHGESGMECTVCHSPVSSNHPQEVMPTDISSRLCANCHVTVKEELDMSVHGQKDLTCVRCHNAHTTNLRSENVQGLCETCHEDYVHVFASTSHAKANLLCTDCHQQIDNNPDRVGPGDITHTFVPNLDTCSHCHQEQMHDPQANACDTEDGGESGIPCDSLEVVESGLTMPQSAALMTEPQPAGPSGFILIGILVGAAAGMILAPWLEKFVKFPRLSAPDNEGEDNE